jgi:small multidrug resistance family-3 protein
VVQEIVRALALFSLAGLAEIGGGWLIWQWLRIDRPWPLGLLGALVLISYGVIHTLQSEAAFGRVYMAYGGIFLVIALAWGMTVDRWRPDRWDLLGASLCLAGVLVMLFGPRANGG